MSILQPLNRGLLPFMIGGVFYPARALAVPIFAIACVRMIASLIDQLPGPIPPGQWKEVRVLAALAPEARAVHLAQWAYDEVVRHPRRLPRFRLVALVNRAATDLAAQASAQGNRAAQEARRTAGTLIDTAEQALDIVEYDALPRLSAARQQEVRRALNEALSRTREARRSLGRELRPVLQDIDNFPDAEPPAIAGGVL
jgi:hypothetical protein